MSQNTKMVDTLKAPSKLNMWLGVLVSSIILVNAAFAIEARYTKNIDFLVFATYAKVSFAELHLEMTQERINRFKAMPTMEREAWQVAELLRLESAKEVQLRRLEGHK